MLLAAGADPCVPSGGGAYGSALHAAVAGAVVGTAGGGGRGMGVLERVLGCGRGDVEVRDAGGLTPLLWVVGVCAGLRARGGGDGGGGVGCMDGAAAVVRMLLGYGARTEAADREGRTALHVAAGAGDVGMVGILLEHGADTEARDGRACTPLLVASERGHGHVVRLLLDAGADVGAEGGNYGTAMQAAVYLGDQDMLQMLGKGSGRSSEGYH